MEGAIEQVGSFKVNELFFIPIVVKEVGRIGLKMIKESLSLGVMELSNVRNVATSHTRHQPSPIIIPANNLSFKLHIGIKLLVLSHVLHFEVHSRLMPVPMAECNLSAS